MEYQAVYECHDARRGISWWGIFFSRVFIAHKWSTIKLGLLPVTTFASFLGIATVLHWDKFTAGHPSFIMWAFLYLTLPFVLPVVWWLNRPADPMTLDEHDSYVPKTIERFFLLMGVFLVLVSVVLLIVPDVLISIWPWTLTPLTARVMGAMFALPGLVGVGIALDKRWSSARIILQSQILSMAFILLAIVLSRGDFDWSQIGSWLFTLSMSAFFAFLIGIYGFMERKARRISA